MSQFEPVTLVFDGKEYTVEKEDGIWGLIEAIEDVVTLMWLAPRLHSQQVPAIKVYRAYSVALQYAGAKGVTPEDIRQGVDTKRMIQMAYELAGILAMGMPPSDLNVPEASAREAEESKKKA